MSTELDKMGAELVAAHIAELATLQVSQRKRMELIARVFCGIALNTIRSDKALRTSPATFLCIAGHTFIEIVRAEISKAAAKA